MSASIAITGVGTAAAPTLEALPEPVRARAVRAERVTQLALVAAERALRGAGLAVVDGEPRAGIGIVLGTAFGCFLTNAAHQRRLATGGPAAVSPRLFAATVSNAAAGEVSVAYRLGGPAVTLTAGGAAGLVALGHAVDLLRAGQAGALVAGGADATGEALVAWQAAAGVRPEGPPAEAAALVVLEPAAAAAARRVPVLGTLLGWAAGFEPAADPAAGAALAAAVEAALAEARVDARDVRLVACGGPPAVATMARGMVAPLAGRETLRPRPELGVPLGAAGPLGLVSALGGAAPEDVVVALDACASGHVAALVARRGA